MIMGGLQRGNLWQRQDFLPVQSTVSSTCSLQQALQGLCVASQYVQQVQALRSQTLLCTGLCLGGHSSSC